MHPPRAADEKGADRNRQHLRAWRQGYGHSDAGAQAVIAFAHKPGLVAYLTCGDPDLQSSREIALALIDAGADVIELGVPFSDPVADGPVIQRASERALRAEVSLTQVIGVGAEIRKARPKTGLIIFTYINPVLRLGLDGFAKRLADAGIDGALVTDLIVEEAGEYISLMRSRELATVFLAAPTSTDDRLRRIAEASRGFVYAVSRTGITGEQKQLAGDAAELVRRVRRFTSLPVAVGFGVSNAEQFQAVGEFADAAVIGSAIVALVEKDGRNAAKAVEEFVRALRRQQVRANSIS
ncbi:MAG: tryptophan synthase subunit alpha [Acidobacteria bacterium]|nr:tryptophan synthase subunit alpha [Acidobacteriota bacterium]MBV9146016.1 tryptophan synthase subunit alpha [Acidobacteriota bacterium]MBV9435725.1 tryptophan synthase subunit alpha [Acidobacteriota bacterium]